MVIEDGWICACGRTNRAFSCPRCGKGRPADATSVPVHGPQGLTQKHPKSWFELSEDELKGLTSAIPDPEPAPRKPAPAPPVRPPKPSETESGPAWQIAPAPTPPVEASVTRPRPASRSYGPPTPEEAPLTSEQAAPPRKSDDWPPPPVFEDPDSKPTPPPLRPATPGAAPRPATPASAAPRGATPGAMPRPTPGAMPRPTPGAMPRPATGIIKKQEAEALSLRERINQQLNEISSQRTRDFVGIALGLLIAFFATSAEMKHWSARQIIDDEIMRGPGDIRDTIPRAIKEKIGVTLRPEELQFIGVTEAGMRDGGIDCNVTIRSPSAGFYEHHARVIKITPNRPQIFGFDMQPGREGIWVVERWRQIMRLTFIGFGLVLLTVCGVRRGTASE